MARTPSRIAAKDSSSFGIIPFVTMPSWIARSPPDVLAYAANASRWPEWHPSSLVVVGPEGPLDPGMRFEEDIRAGGREGLLLEVWDSGPAIPVPAMARLFDRFYRAEASRSRTGVHCGIGLSLVSALCKVLGIEVGAENLPDGSVAFRLQAGRSDRAPRLERVGVAA